MPESNERNPIEALAEEFLTRYRGGERPPLSEYMRRHPALADEIRDLFPALVMMEEVVPSGPITTDGGCPGDPPARLPMERVGEYRLLRELGRGGMGVVYEAEHESLGRHVALKLLQEGSAADAVRLERFRREARAAARLHHTNIVPVFDVGTCNGIYYYAMQYIRGQSLEDVLKDLRRLRRAEAAQSPLPPRTDSKAAVSVQLASALLSGQVSVEEPNDPPHQAAREVPQQSTDRFPASLSAQRDYYHVVARIGLQVAEALSYAHGQKVLHRDIKPANLLFDLQGVVWVTDFGLAKSEEVELTQTGDLVGTLRYMAPERFNGISSTSSDIYGLGLTLYEMLTLRPAFDEGDRGRLIRRVMNEEPVRPRTLDRHIPRDLETIVLEAIHKDSKRRYQSAEAMAEDLRRFIGDEPIKAKRASQLARLRLWSRRNPALAALLLLVIMVAAASMSAAYYLRVTLIESEENRRHVEKAELEGQHKLWLSYLSQARAVRMSRQPGQRFDSLRAIKEALDLPLPPNHSRDELRTEAIAALCLPDSELIREGGREAVGASSFTIDPNFERYAWGDKDGNVAICRLSDDKQLLQLPGAGLVHDYGGLEFSPNGRFLHQMSITARGARSRLWDLNVAQPKPVLDDNHTGLTFRPDSGEVAASYADRTIRFFDPTSGRELRRFTVDLVPAEVFLWWNPKLPQLLVGNRTSLRLLNVDTGTTLEVGPKIPEGYEWITWHPEGRLLAVSARDRKIHLWDVPAALPVLPPLEGHKNFGIRMNFNHAGDRLLSTDWNGIWYMWDTHSGRLLQTLSGLGAHLFFRSDDRLVGSGRLGRTRIDNFRRGEEFRTGVRRTKISHRFVAVDQSSPSLDPEARLCALYTAEGVALVDVARSEEAALLPLPGNGPLCFESEGALWTHGEQGLLRWPLTVDPKTAQRRYGPPRRFFGRTTVDLHGSSTDAQVLAIPQYNAGALVMHRESRRRLWLGPQQDVRNCAVSPDGLWVATGSHGLREGVGAKVWDAKNGRHVKNLPVGAGCQVQFSPDRKWLLTTLRAQGEIRLWAVGTWEEGPSLGGARLRPRGAFSCDGKLLALGDKFGMVRLVVPDTGAEIARLTTPEQTHFAPCCFTPDGAQLITVGTETATIHIFDLRAIRAGLAELGLDWDAPLLPAAAAAPATRLSIHFDLGDSMQWNRADALIRQAHQQNRAKEHAKGLASLREAVKIAPNHATAHNNLAWLLLTGLKELRNPPQALIEARKAVELEPERSLFVNTMGVALYYTGQFAEAILALEQSLHGGHGDSDACDLFFLAMCHHRLGNATKARDCHERGKQWFMKHKGHLHADLVEELNAFQAEANGVLAKPPDQGNK